MAISARVNDGRIPQGLSAIAQEVARVRQFGFGEAEFDRAQRSTLAQYERRSTSGTTDKAARWPRSCCATT